MPLVGLEYDPDGILEGLKGRQKIHVGRKVIVASLKQTTSALAVLMKDTLEKDKLIRSLTESNKQLLELSRKLQSRMIVINETLAKQDAIIKDHDKVIGSGKIKEALDDIEKMKVCQEHLDNRISDAFKKIDDTEEILRSEMSDKDSAMNDRVLDLKEELTDVNERMHATEERWKDLGTTTNSGYKILSSQVVYGEDKLSLKRVITSMREDMTDQMGGIEIILGEHKALLKKIEPKVKLVPRIRDIARDNHNMLKSLGVGDGDGKSLLEQIQNLRSSVSSNARSLLEKADAKKITEVIENKYDEIVEHLQLAISSACDEEDEFKRVAGELRKMVKDLMTNKADRADLARMGERIAADKTVRDDVAMMKIQFADLVNRKEVGELLKEKLSRQDGLAVIESHAKKLGRRINAMLASVMGVTQQIAESKTIKGANVVGESMRTESKSNSRFGYEHSDASSGRRDGSERKGGRDSPTMGPGSASLGGGFRVMLAGDRERLPKIKDSGN